MVVAAGVAPGVPFWNLHTHIHFVSVVIHYQQLVIDYCEIQKVLRLNLSLLKVAIALGVNSRVPTHMYHIISKNGVVRVLNSLCRREIAFLDGIPPEMKSWGEFPIQNPKIGRKIFSFFTPFGDLF